MTPRHETVRVEDVQILGERRSVDRKAVASLAQSMAEIGLQTPITVRLVDDIEIDGYATDGVPVLVAGRHRLAAAQELGWEKIDCVIIDYDDARQAEIWEIDENLMRAELSTEEKREHLRRRKEIWERQQAETSERGTWCPTFQSAAPGQKGFAADTAEKTGMSKRQINRLLAEPKPAKPVSPPDAPLHDYEAKNKQVQALMAAWNKAGQEAREAFLEMIGER